MRLRPFFSFYGSKWRLAPKYPAPAHNTIIEPFAGSAGYSLLYPDRDVLLFDADPIICGVWDYLIHAPESEVLALPDLEQGQSIAELPDLTAEAQALMGFWVSRASAQPKQVLTGYAIQTPDSGWGSKVRQRIVSQQQYIRHWKVANTPYQSLENRRAAWFVDPPYQNKGRFYRFSSANIDYADLAEWCRQRLGQVIVCENTGADWLPFDYLATGNSSRHLTAGSKEAVYIQTSE